MWKPDLPLFLLILLILCSYWSSVPTVPIDPLFLLILPFLLILCYYWSMFNWHRKLSLLSGCLWSRVRLYLHFLMQSTNLVTIYLQLLANKMTWWGTNTNLSVTKMAAMPWFNMRHDLSIHLHHTSPLFDILLIPVPISLSALPEVLHKIQTFHKF